MTTRTFQIFFIFVYLIGSSKLTIAQTDKVSGLNKNSTKIYSYEFNCLNVVDRCDLKILKLINYDTLIYIFSSESWGQYEEFHGKLTKINDSIYHVKCFKTLTQGATKPIKFPVVDTLTIICDTSMIGKSLRLIYENKTSKQFKIYSIVNEFPINKVHFNHTNGKIRISFEYPHPIVDENVEIIGRHNCDIYFTSPKGFYDFYVIISESIIKTINLEPDISQGPSFYLKRMPLDGHFSRGRKLRGQKNGT